MSEFLRPSEYAYSIRRLRLFPPEAKAANPEDAAKAWTEELCELGSDHWEIFQMVPDIGNISIEPDASLAGVAGFLVSSRRPTDPDRSQTWDYKLRAEPFSDLEDEEAFQQLLASQSTSGWDLVSVVPQWDLRWAPHDETAHAITAATSFYWFLWKRPHLGSSSG